MSEIYRIHKISNIRSNLGESPVWDERGGLLYFVDITEGRINVLTPQARVETVHQSTGRIGALALTDQGNLVFTENACVAIFNVEQGEVTRKAPPTHSVQNYRFNDGACDPQGRFITGLMDEGHSKNTGALYRYDRELNSQLIHSDMSLPNGLAWSKDGSVLFFVDSVKCSIFQAEHLSDGSLGTVALFAETPNHLGRPDGIALDEAGGLWVCQFNGGCLLHYDSSGCLSERIDMPVPRPTSCCFGGDNLDILYITTARIAMTPAELGQYPDAGDLYAIYPDTVGIRRHLFKE